MTRFARATGSKASNEKTPKDSTPWEVMKEQLIQTKKESEEAKKRIEADNQRQQNYEKFLKEQRIQKRNTTWCDFPDEGNSSKKKKVEATITNTLKTSKKIKKMKSKVNTDISEKCIVSNEIDNIPKAVDVKSDVGNKKVKSKKKKHLSKLEVADGFSNDNQSEQNVPDVPKKILNEKSLKIGDKQIPEKIGKTKKKNKKSKEGKPVRRKVIDDNSFQLIINGKDVELVRFDGFPIMKKDAERIKDLRNNMIQKGIPKSEVERTIKLERRRAEKALARLKRDVCYNCRKGGHNLSDCPELKSLIPGGGGEAPDGVCFKCGSTEHRQFECKVLKDQEFRFATCFICKEQGHIARQCPDNAKGLYPNGGCCKLCGDVTHLRKDCPTVKDKKEESSIRLDTWDTVDNTQSVTESTQKQTKQIKKIKF